MNARTVLNADEINRAVTRISHEIVESNHGIEDLLLLGIPTRGVFLAERIAQSIGSNYPNFDAASSLGKLDRIFPICYPSITYSYLLAYFISLANIGFTE